MFLSSKIISEKGTKIPHFEPIFSVSSHESSHKISSHKTHTPALTYAETFVNTMISDLFLWELLKGVFSHRFVLQFPEYLLCKMTTK